MIENLLKPTHLIVILLILLLLFGGKKLPELAEGIGKALKRFKETQKDDPKKDDDKSPKV